MRIFQMPNQLERAPMNRRVVVITIIQSSQVKSRRSLSGNLFYSGRRVIVTHSHGRRYGIAAERSTPTQKVSNGEQKF